jgi:putative endonuclease
VAEALRWLRHSKPPYIHHMQGFMYILLCGDGSYYTGSTKSLELRVAQHRSGEGANHTRKHQPVSLIYYEWYPRVDMAFYREKQVQGWSRKKKEALINGQLNDLPNLAKAYRDVRSNNSSDRLNDGSNASDLEKQELDQTQ